MTLILRSLTEGAPVGTDRRNRAVGHRVVHGAETFTGSVLIDEAVIATIERVADLAPLHNPPNLVGIRAAQHALPHIPHVACFDTAFHTSIPRVAYTYALPYALYEQFGIRRYGFHGTSHRYVAGRAAELLGAATGRHPLHHVPSGQRLFDGGRPRRQERRYLDGPDAARRPGDGDPQRRFRPRDPVFPGR